MILIILYGIAGLAMSAVGVSFISSGIIPRNHGIHIGTPMVMAGGLLLLAAARDGGLI